MYVADKDDPTVHITRVIDLRSESAKHRVPLEIYEIKVVQHDYF